jgi:hypothetical protein
MSTNEQVFNNGQQAITNYNTAKMFIFGNRYTKGTYTNDTGDDVVLDEGTLMGRISATQKLVPHDSDASDGSQYPVGILKGSYSVADGDDTEVAICVEGDVAEELVILAYGDTMDTVISDRSIRDRIAADTVGIKLVAGTELTGYDNQ